MIEAKKLPEEYGSLVFGDKVMRERLPKDVYKAVHKTIVSGTHLELDVANAVAVGIDSMNLHQILGCVAGDDTIIVVSRDEECARTLSSRFHDLMRNS